MKNKKTTFIFIVSVLLSLIIGFLYLRFDRLKLIKCLKEAETYRDELLLNADLTPNKIISIEQATDRKRDECYVLYKR
jgi:hypothetical protein